MSKHTLRQVSVMALLLATLMCSSGETYVSGPQTHDNSEAREIEVNMIREGDKLIRVKALLGEPTVYISNQDGKIMEYWLVPAKGMGRAYRTLKIKPETIDDDTKFIKLKFNSKDIVIKKEYNL